MSKLYHELNRRNVFKTIGVYGAAEWKWDIDVGRTISIRLVSNLEGDFEMDNEKFFTKFNRSEKHKALDY